MAPKIHNADATTATAATANANNKSVESTRPKAKGRQRSLTSFFKRKPSNDEAATSPPSNNKKRKGIHGNAISAGNLGPASESFGAVWAGNCPGLMDKSIKIHTLVLGTHPSIASLHHGQYYAHPKNAFWWIAGDCLGFRRDSKVPVLKGQTTDFSQYLKHDNVVPYEEQMKTFCRHGFAIWDVLQSCHREGSLDENINHDDAVANDIRGFCEAHPSIRRIVFSSGVSTAEIFKKHFEQSWLNLGDLVPAANGRSQHVFKKWKPKESYNPQDKIECISVISVSPTAIGMSYEGKRDEWREFVYEPGLADHKRLNQKK